MKLPFTITNEEFEAFKPRKQWAQRDDLDPDYREIMEQLDIVDQQKQWLANVSISNRWGLIVLTGLYFVTNGQQALQVLLRWAGVTP